MKAIMVRFGMFWAVNAAAVGLMLALAAMQ